MSADAGAEDWRITPHLNLKETYTDNVTLAPKGQEQSEFVTQIKPGVSVSKTGTRLKVNAAYTLQSLSYLRDSRRNNIKHQLNANANAEWVEDFFFTDVKATVSQQNVSLSGAQSSDNINVTGNRADVRTYSVSPYIRSRIGNFANYLVRYTHTAVNTSAAGISDSQADRINAELNSAKAFYKLGWRLLYNKENVNNANFQDYQRERFTGELRYLLSRKLSLVGAYGYENNTFLTTGPKPEGSVWNAGFMWTPSIRTKLEARVGKRYFGDTYLLDFSHRSRRTVWSVRYNEDVTSTHSQFFIPVAIDTAGLLDIQFSSVIPDTLIRAQFVEDFIIQNGLPRTTLDSLNFLANQAFLQKRLQAAVSVNGVRNTMIFSLFNINRSVQQSGTASSALLGDADFSFSDNIEQYGASAFWNLRITPRTSSNLGVSYSRNEFKNSGRQDDLTSVRLGVNKQLAKKLKGSADLRHIERSSNEAGNDYKENAVTVSVGMTF